MIAGPLVSLSGVAVLLGAYDQVSPWSALLTLPEVVWELFLGVSLTARGLRRRGAPVGLDRATDGVRDRATS
jgi:hypothetical protein